jgi:hypothetical protein
MQYTPREYAAMAVACGSAIDLGAATQAELDHLVREYLVYMATLAQN